MTMKLIMKKYALIFTVLLLIGGLLVAGQLMFSRPVAELELTPVAGKQFGGDFTLYAEDKPVSLSDFKGKVVLMYFGYASCPDVCPTSLALLGTALKKLKPEELAQVQGLFISVDPERDQGEKLTAYAEHFHPSFIGITGSIEQISQVSRQYGNYFKKSDSTSAMGYLVDHGSKTYVIGKNGGLAQLLPHDMAIPDILAAVRSAL